MVADIDSRQSIVVDIDYVLVASAIPAPVYKAVVVLVLIVSADNSDSAASGQSVRLWRSMYSE